MGKKKGGGKKHGEILEDVDRSFDALMDVLRIYKGQVWFSAGDIPKFSPGWIISRHENKIPVGNHHFHVQNVKTIVS